MKTFLKVILYLIGFPLLLTFVALESVPVIKNGITYWMVWGGVAVAGLMGLIYLITALVTWSVSRKAQTLKKIRKCTAALVIVGFICTTGLWIAVDIVLPPILEDGTDGTIEYEDLMDDYKATSDFHALLLSKFIKMNVANGNLTKLTEKQYLEEGARNEEVKNLIETNFKSIDQDGYQTFEGPWLDLANDDRMTIPVVIHLVLNKRKVSTQPFIFSGEGREADPDAPINWTIIDMQEGALEFDLSSILNNESISGMKPLIGMFLPEILGALNKAVAEDALAGSPIYIDLDLDTGIVSITPAAESRGVWDYMHMAWLNSNDLLFLIISLFPLRSLFLMFGGVLVITSFLIGLIREKQYKKNLVAQKAVAAPAGKTDSYFSHKDPEALVSPYLKSYYQSLEDYNSRG